MDVSKLEKQADLLAQTLEGWENSTVKRIAKRIGEVGKMSVADVQALNNAAIVKGDMKIIIKELAQVTGQNISEIEKIYGDVLRQNHLDNKPLYDYRGIDFIPFEQNTELQAIVSAYSRTTAETMINLSKTTAQNIGIVGTDGKFQALGKFYTDSLDKAVLQVTSGTTDFYTAMRDTIRDLGGSGMRVNYGSGVTRRLDTAVRQSLLWGAKQASIEYQNMIGEELDCTGVEIDWHTNPRPSHEFMQGRQFAVGEEVTINGVTYPSADDSKENPYGVSVNEALEDYGCLHFATPIILGISEPTYDPKELQRLNEENERPITIGDKTQKGYDWKQDMRKLETEVRRQQGIKQAAKSEGDNELVRKCNARIKSLKDKYSEISEATGIKEQPQRMTVVNKVSENQVASIKKVEYQFTPAKTIEEAEEFAKSMVDDKQFGALGVSYKGIGLDSANEINKTLGELTSRFNVGKFGGIVAPSGNTKLGKQISGATAAYSPIRKSFVLNRASLKSVDVANKAFLEDKKILQDVIENPQKYDFSKMRASTAKTIEKSIVSGRATVPENIREAITHEFGHALERQVFSHPKWNDVLNDMEQYSEKISGYATTNKSEYIAESFVSYIKGENLIDGKLKSIFEELEIIK